MGASQASKVVSKGHLGRRSPLWAHRVVRLYNATNTFHIAPRGAVQIGTNDLVELRERLNPRSLPRANIMYTSVRNVIEGRVEGRFYTDEWPDFTTVVFQCFQPRLSDVSDLYCCTSSRQQLPRVLEQARLVTTGQWQYLHIVEDDDNAVTDFLFRNLRLDGEARLSHDDYSVQKCGIYALLAGLPTINSECPVGYSHGELLVEHSTYLSSQSGPWSNSMGRPVGVLDEYYKHCIQNFESVAIFSDCNSTTPVGWVMQHGWSEMGNLFIMEEHRRKGLAVALLTALCQKILARGDMPSGSVAVGVPSSFILTNILGFQHVGILKDVCLHFGLS